jgi:hypothetical protein
LLHLGGEIPNLALAERKPQSPLLPILEVSASGSKIKLNIHWVLAFDIISSESSISQV